MMKRSPLFVLVMAVLVLLGVLMWALPAEHFSELENRTLAELPSADVSSLTNGNWGVGLESYAADHFPLRNGLVSARATLHLLYGDVKQQSSLAGRSGWLFEVPPQSMTRVARLSVETLNELTQALNVPGTLLVIPTSADTMAAAMPALYAFSAQQSVLDELFAYAPDMTCIRNPLLGHEGDTSLYYRTDHHLTAEGSRLCYLSLCDAFGLMPNEGERVVLGGFKGSYYARVPSLTVPAEDFSVELPAGVSVTLDGAPADFLDPERLLGRNKYAALFTGTYAHVMLENPTGEGSLLVLCDSYANALTPMLASHFARVDMIDMRYFTGDLGALAEEAGTTRLLAVYGLNTLSANRSLLLMDIPERRAP